MTYNVFGGTFNLAQSINQSDSDETGRLAKWPLQVLDRDAHVFSTKRIINATWRQLHECCDACFHASRSDCSLPPSC